MAVSAELKAILNVRELLASGVPASSGGDAVVVHDDWNQELLLNGTSAAPVTKVAAFQQALSSGAATIDLTSLTGANGATVDGTGLKVQAVFVKNNGTNVLKIAKGATNPYDLGNSGSDAQALYVTASGWTLIYGNEKNEDISSTAKDLDLTGTASQSSDWIILMG